MDGGDHQIECAQYIIGVIETSISQNITFNTFENAEGGIFRIQLFDLLMLLPDPLFTETTGISSRLTMVADHEIFQLPIQTAFNHFLNRMNPITPGAMRVNDSSDILFGY